MTIDFRNSQSERAHRASEWSRRLPVRTLTLFLIAVATGVALLLTACNSLPEPQFLDEQPVGSDTWVSIDAQPAWVTTPPPKDGTRRFVQEGKSNMRSIVTIAGRPLASRFFEVNVAEALSPLIGDAAAEVTAKDALAKLVLVSRACKEEVLSKRMVPGNTLCTAWALWELPLDDAVSTVPEEQRAAARELLATIDLTSRPESLQRK